MTRTIKTLVLILLLITGYSVSGQTNKEEAYKKGREAVKLMDAGKIDESIMLLEEAQKLDPDRFDYPYEQAYAYYLKKAYNDAIRILEANKSHKNVTDILFQLLGNSYDLLGKTEEAFKSYDEGLKMFPNSGSLYLEKGNIYWGKKDYNKALPFYEKGIEVEPGFASNYYRAAKLYCSSSESLWGLLYGEIFMNIERNSKRTAEISALLFNTYKSRITINPDSSKIDFCNIVIDAKDLTNTTNIKLPFCMVFGQAFMLSIINAKEVNMTSLDLIRTAFVENYFKMGYNKTHPNGIIEYQDKILKSGQSEAYNHWILSKGDQVGFENWQSANKDKWESFLKWFSENKFKIDDNNKVYSGRY